MLLETIARTPRLQSLPPRQRRIVGALRLWVALHKSGEAPMARLTNWLGGTRTAAHLMLLIEEMGAAWPDPFCVSPPCCQCLSHDEATMAGMMTAAAQADRPGFDRLLSDLLPEDARERLFLSASVLTRVMAEQVR